MFDNVNTSKLRLATLLLLLPVLAACSKSFVVTSEVPKPLIERLPVSAKLVYSENFREYVYLEKGKDRALEKVDFGAAQVGLFDRVFGDLVTLVDDGSSPDLKIEPQILDFQYSVPAETKLNMYEIWLKYRLKITDGQDVEVADWVVKGYGKTPTSMLESQLKAFNSASNMALRDIGAQLALGFQSQPSIEGYLNGLSKNGVSTDNSSNEAGPGVEAPPSEVDGVPAEGAALSNLESAGAEVGVDDRSDDDDEANIESDNQADSATAITSEEEDQ